MKTIFFGASSYVIPLIEFLNKTYDLALIVTTEQKPSDTVIRFCKENNLPFLSVTTLNDVAIEKIKSIKAPFAVLADFRLMIRQHVLDIFPKGIINVHPSLLPEYRGPTPGLSAILDGKKESGVSLMLIDKNLDHGPLIGQVKLPVEPNDTSPTLYKRFFEKGAQLLEHILPDYLDGKVKPTEQDNTKTTYSAFLKRDSGFFDSSNPVQKERLGRMIRAYFPWPGVWTKVKLNGTEKIIKLLPENKIQVEGKKPQTYRDFLNGYPHMKNWLEKITN